MVGNSHIDPVWFWCKEEGLQEVKATFLSALERMNEYPDFTFTASSSYFYEYLERVAPEIFERIQKRVKEGRFEIAGGWIVEADCCMPDGESLVRQGLYGQRYFQSRFGRICEIGFAPDTFGHAQTIPMLLSGEGMTSYCHQRPDHPECALSRWTSRDGSSIVEFHLPSEYTIWFEDQLKTAIAQTVEHIPDGGSLPCFYGVGNHGGGPTIENIETIRRYTDTVTDAGDRIHLRLGTLRSFFSGVKEETLPESSGGREGLGGGCYAVDSQLKRQMRLAEHSTLRAEKLWTMAVLMGCRMPDTAENPAAVFEKIWKDILFNQFHDIICGTSIKPARDHAMMELGGAVAAAREMENFAIQAIANANDTRGDGFPLFLFNPHLEEFDGIYEAEIPWFCKAHMALLNDCGEEIPYQRVKTDCTMVNYNLSGRRRIVFRAKVPSYGFAVYRLAEREPSCESEMGPQWITAGLPVCKKEHRQPGEIGLMANVGYEMENEKIRVTFDRETGLPRSILEKETGHEALCGPMEAVLYQDTGDTWGGGGEYVPCGERLEPASMRLIENGFLRKVAMVETKAEECTAKWRFTLYQGEKELHCSVRVCNSRGHKSLVWRTPLTGTKLEVRAQIPHGTAVRPAQGKGNYMQGFLDVSEDGRGITLYNNGRYCYTLSDTMLMVPLSRSAIYAQGGFQGWQNDNLDLDYTDTGLTECGFVLTPHGCQVSSGVLHDRAMRMNQPLPCLFDTWHTGEKAAHSVSLLSRSGGGVVLAAAKPAEEGGIVLRLLETEEKEKTVALGNGWKTELKPAGLATLLVKDGKTVSCDLLERPLPGEKGE